MGHLRTHLFMIHQTFLMSPYFVLDTVQGTRDTKVSKTFYYVGLSLPMHRRSTQTNEKFIPFWHKRGSEVCSHMLGWKIRDVGSQVLVSFCFATPAARLHPQHDLVTGDNCWSSSMTAVSTVLEEERERWVYPLPFKEAFWKATSYSC